jgi:hypothetical protein
MHLRIFYNRPGIHCPAAIAIVGLTDPPAAIAFEAKTQQLLLLDDVFEAIAHHANQEDQPVA